MTARRSFISRLRSALPPSVANRLGVLLQLFSHAVRLVGAHLDIAGRALSDSDPQTLFLPTDPPPLRSVPIDRVGAATWAVEHVNDPLVVDPACTYFVSEALRIGGGLAPTSTWFPGIRRSRVRWWRPIANSRPYGCVGDFAVDLRKAGWVRARSLDTHDDVVHDVRLGDVFLYNWDGFGRFQHMAIVSRIDDGVPFVTQQSPSQRNRQWNRKADGTWIHTAVLLGFITADETEVPDTP